MHRVTIKRLILAVCLLGSAQAAFAGDKEERLTAAVRGRDHAAVKQALADGAQPNLALADRSVPLAWAIDRRDIDSVRMLLAAGAKPNATDFYGNPLLFAACELGDEDIVLGLIDAGASAKAIRSDGLTALAVCSGSSTALAIKTLAEKGADVNRGDKTGQTPLMRAAASGLVDNIGILITLGAKLDDATRSGATPLFFALQSGNRQAPMMLLDAGAKTSRLTPEGQTVIEAALAAHNEAFVAEVMKRGVTLSDRNKRGWQLIHTLAAGGYTELVKLAISLGAEPNSLTQPPAEPAKTDVAGNADDVKVDKKGADKKDDKVPVEKLIALAPPSPRTPLMLAAEGGHIDAMKALVAAGAHPKDKAPDGMTVTLAAVSSGDVATVTYALTLEPNIAATVQGGRTALFLAVRSPNSQGAETLIPFLVDKGVNLEAQDDRGVTAGEIVNRVGPANLRTLYNKLLKDHGLPPVPERKLSVD